MKVFAVSDLHLPGRQNKPMDVFGGRWINYVDKLVEGFSQLTDGDTTVLCGDLSWGMSLEESLQDLTFIHELPGKKILMKGNHDYWWNTAAKMQRFFDEHGLDSLQILHNNCTFYGDVALCGTRGWFYELEEPGSHTEKMRNREAGRLETSLRAAGEREKLCFLHYPPLYTGYRCEEMLRLLQQYGVKRCYYGHLHGGMAHSRAVQGERDGTDFSLVSADYLRFKPKKILE